MDLRDRLMVLCLALLDRVLDFFTWAFGQRCGVKSSLTYG